MSTVAILSPGFPLVPGGVTDHTARLKANWEAAGHNVRVIGDPAVGAEQLARDLRQDGVTAVLIQYVPFLYGRRGVSSFPRTLARSAVRLGLRVTTFVHEPWVPPTRLPWLVLSPIQRRQLRNLMRASDTVVTAVPAWKQMLAADEIVHVGSTLGEAPRPGQSELLEAAVVFSPFAAGLDWDWIAAAAAALGNDLIVVGASAVEMRTHPIVKRYARRSWEYLGRLPEHDVLIALAHARLILAPFVDGLTARRTSAMAALSTGARVLSNTGPLFDPMFWDSPVSIVTDKAEFVSSARELWATDDTPAARDERLEWYRRTLDPKQLDARLLALILGTA